MRGSNGDYTGTLTGIVAEANADTLVFVVGGGEYSRQVGASVAFNDGDQIYISKDRIYTIRIASARLDSTAKEKKGRLHTRRPFDCGVDDKSDVEPK